MTSFSPRKIPDRPSRRDTLMSPVLRSLGAYSQWLNGISWKRFFVLSVLALIVSGILADLPPFNIPWGDDKPASQSAEATGAMTQPEVRQKIKGEPFVVRVDDKGVRIGPVDITGDEVRVSDTLPAPAASSIDDQRNAAPGVSITLPEQIDADRINRLIDHAEAAIEQTNAKRTAGHAFRLGTHLSDVTVLLIVVSMIIKIMATGRLRAETQAAVATEKADAETLKRQVVEARMAAMQAQVEPHFLFNTLASIDHLIETDPPRASKMQRNLIALLRASMPSMREANAQGSRDLESELAVIRPYLEILKVRMEDRLATDIRVSEGLLSADFPAMMLQSLVENAIKHGLEPMPAGGTLTISAKVEHGRLAVTVADDGLGFGQAATAGTGIGLSNIRERLELLYGAQANLSIAAQPGGGTAATITVPYLMRKNESCSA